MTSSAIQLDPGGSPLPFRRRQDLVLQPRPEAGEWIVKDPLCETFYVLGSAEYFLWERLDGRHSLKDLLQEFHQVYAPQHLTPEEILRYAGQLAAQGLLLGAGQASVPVVERREDWLSQLRQHPWSIRWRGIDPDRWLTVFTPWLGWCFSAPLVWFGLVLLFLTGFQLFGKLELLQQELRDWPRQPGVILATMVAVVMVVKGLHELGHAIACKRWGGECHELGVMMLFGTPCLYCNVSDAWLFPSRWSRAAVSAAGIYVELWLAVGSAWVWLCSVPGLVHQCALQCLLLCSVNTLLLNGNPLLRYDGYYVLSDLCDYPNLRSRATALWQAAWTGWLWGQGLGPRRAMSGLSSLLLTGYGLASSVYLWVLLISLFLTLHDWLRPWGLEGFVTAGGTLILGTRAVQSGRTGHALLHQALGMASGNSGKLMRVWGGTLIALLIPVGLAFYPWSLAIQVPAAVVPTEVETLYVLTSGSLHTLPPTMGSRLSRPVSAGEPIGILRNIELERSLQELRGEINQLQSRVDSLRERLPREPQLASLLSASEVALQARQERLTAELIRQQQLELRAHREGILITSSRSISASSVSALNEEPNRVNGLQEQCLGRTFPVGEIASRVMGPRRSAILYVPQTHLPDLPVTTPLRLQFPQTPGQLWAGTVVEIGTRPLVKPTPDLLLDARLAAQPNSTGFHFLEPVFEVRVELAETADSLYFNQLGTARWHPPAQPGWQHLLRWLGRIFPGLRIA